MDVDALYREAAGHFRGGDLRRAEAALLAAAERAPGATAFHNVGGLYWRTGRLEEAAAAYRRALAMEPHHTGARVNLGNVLLALGDDAGWALYDDRDERRTTQAHKLGFPEWRGEPLDGKRLFVWTEQGLGDQIFAARYLPMLGAASVTVAALPPLARLYGQLPVRVIPVDEKTPVGPHDYWTLPLSLPRYVAPAPTPYLQARPRPTGARIGVMWRGNSLPDPGRSLPEEVADRLLSLPDAISLQPEATGARDFLDTAEIIAGLELVITIDTSVAHLTGAMRKRGVVLLQHHASDWRWREGAPGTSRWYPSLRLVRQPRPSDWPAVVDQLTRMKMM